MVTEVDNMASIIIGKENYSFISYDNSFNFEIDNQH
jgi:hypothetical protein